MRAIVYKGPNEVSVETVPDPRIESPTDAIVARRYLNQFNDALRRMYYDGQRPIIEPLAECSVKALVAKRLDDLSRNRNQEHIVAETRDTYAVSTAEVT